MGFTLYIDDSDSSNKINNIPKKNFQVAINMNEMETISIGSENKTIDTYSKSVGSLKIFIQKKLGVRLMKNTYVQQPPSHGIPLKICISLYILSLMNSMKEKCEED